MAASGVFISPTPANHTAKKPTAQSRVLFLRSLDAVAPIKMPSQIKAGQPMSGISSSQGR